MGFNFFASGLKSDMFSPALNMVCRENPRESHRAGTEQYESRTCEEEISTHHHKEQRKS